MEMFSKFANRSIRYKFRQAAYLFGSFSVVTSIALYGYISHAPGFSPEQISRLQHTAAISMFSGVGLCLLKRRVGTWLVLLPMGLFGQSLIMMLGSLIFQKVNPGQSERVSWLVPVGLSCSAAAWASMALL